MRLLLRVLALILALGTFLWWWASGRNTGWSKHSVAVEKTDELTGITYTDYEDRYVPGVEIPGGAAAAALVLAGVSFLPRRKPASAGESA